MLHHSGHSRQGEGAVAASRGTTALPAAFSQVINLSWFKRRESKTDKRVLLETAAVIKGYKVRTTVTKNLDILVLGEAPGEKKKY